MHSLRADILRTCQSRISRVPTIRAPGHSSLRAIAAELNARGMLTRRGGRWHVSNVRNLLARLARSGIISG